MIHGLISGYGPLESVDYEPLTGYQPAPKGGLAAPLMGGIASAPAPQWGAGLAAGGRAAECIVNSGQKLRTSKFDENSGLVMVGSGDECEPSGWVVSAVCPKCGHHVQLVKHGCGRILCPVCASRWTRRAAERAAARLMGAFSAGASKHHPRHITFDLDTLSWDAAKKKAASLGATGGVLVLHPWRLKSEYKAMFEVMAERTGMNRYDVAKRSAIGMDAFEWSPHCHALVYGRFEDVRRGSDIFLYRNIRRLNSLHAAEGSLMYLFGHTFIPLQQNGKCYRYFGICSPQRLKPAWTGSCSAELHCECCDAIMVQEGTMETVCYKRYIALGWVVKPPRRRGEGGLAPPANPAC